MRKFSITGTVLTIVLLTGCVQLPRDGQIQLGPDLQNELTTDYLYYSPSGPVDGDSAEQIIEGFLNAGTGPQNDYAVAREFLTTKFRTKWDPNQRVLIQDGKPQVTLTVDDSASVTVTASAQVDEQGKYESLTNGTRETFNYLLEKEGGQWRIAEAPNVTMIIRPVFDAVFREYSIYFFDNQQKYLIPDVRWFPARASTSTRLVAAMLKGPSDWLVGAVRSPIPEGTKLSLSTVSVSDGVANVDLSAKALNASRSALQLAIVQLKETLMQLDGVFSVQVSIERTPIETIPTTTGLVTPLTYSPVVLSEGSISHVGISNSTTVTSATDLIGKYGATDFALSPDEKRFVMVTPTGVYSANLNNVNQNLSLLTVAQGWLSPIIDRQGFIWLIPKSGKKQIEVFDANGNKIDFNSGRLTQQNRIGFSISNEGGRAAIITGKTGNTQVRYASIMRNQEGIPRNIDSPVTLDASPNAVAIAWIDETQIGFIENQGDGYTIPLVAKIGGSIRQLPSVQNAVQISGSGLESSIFVLDKFGALMQYRGTNWTVVRGNVDAIHFPGN